MIPKKDHAINNKMCVVRQHTSYYLGGAMDIQPIQNISLKQEVKRSLKRVIKHLEKTNKTRLPGELELSQRLAVSRVTVRDVMKEFEQEGIIYKIQGKGTFININALKMKVTLSPAVEFKQVIEKNGYKPTVELVEIITGLAEKKVALGLHLDPDAITVCAKKIFYADGKPVIYCEDTFEKNLINGELIENDLIESTFEYLLNYAGITVTHDIVEVIATNSSKLPDHGQLYHISESKPLLLLQSVYYTAKNRPVMFVKAYFDTEYIKLSLLRRQDVYFTD